MTYKGLKDDKSHNTHSDIWQFNKIVAYGITMIRLFIRLTKFQINTGFWFFLYQSVYTRVKKHSCVALCTLYRNVHNKYS